jgi:hypothetical protein
MDVPSLEQRAARMSSDPLKRLLAEYRDLIESYWAEESAV